jgi:hypothetical protein
MFSMILKFDSHFRREGFQIKLIVYYFEFSIFFLVSLNFFLFNLELFNYCLKFIFDIFLVYKQL